MANVIASLPTTNTQKLLDCPVCLITFRGEIYSCINGHNICSVCRPRLDVCPVCKEEITNTRNRLVEELLSGKFSFPCENIKLGCKQIMSLSELSEHQVNCNYKSVKCIENGCVWSGLKGRMKEHILTNHNVLIVVSKELLFIDKDFQNFEKAHSDHLYMNIKNELFLIQYERNVNRKITFTVSLLEPIANVNNRYHFKIRLENENRTKCMLLQGDINTDGNKRLETNIKIDYDTAEQFLRYNNIFQYIVQIEINK